MKNKILEKEAYRAAVLELVRFDGTDIITTSGAEGTGSDNPPNEDDWDTWL